MYCRWISAASLIRPRRDSPVPARYGGLVRRTANQVGRSMLSALVPAMPVMRRGQERVFRFPPAHASTKLAVSATEKGAETEQLFPTFLERLALSIRSRSSAG